MEITYKDNYQDNSGGLSDSPIGEPDDSLFDPEVEGVGEVEAELVSSPEKFNLIKFMPIIAIVTILFILSQANSYIDEDRARYDKDRVVQMLEEQVNLIGGSCYQAADTSLVYHCEPEALLMEGDGNILSVIDRNRIWNHPKIQEFILAENPEFIFDYRLVNIAILNVEKRQFELTIGENLEQPYYMGFRFFIELDNNPNDIKVIYSYSRYSPDNTGWGLSYNIQDKAIQRYSNDYLSTRLYKVEQYIDGQWFGVVTAEIPKDFEYFTYLPYENLFAGYTENVTTLFQSNGESLTPIATYTGNKNGEYEGHIISSYVDVQSGNLTVQVSDGLEEKARFIFDLPYSSVNVIGETGILKIGFSEFGVNKAILFDPFAGRTIAELNFDALINPIGSTGIYHFSEMPRYNLTDNTIEKVNLNNYLFLFNEQTREFELSVQLPEGEKHYGGTNNDVFTTYDEKTKIFRVYDVEDILRGILNVRTSFQNPFYNPNEENLGENKTPFVMLHNGSALIISDKPDPVLLKDKMYLITPNGLIPLNEEIASDLQIPEATSALTPSPKLINLNPSRPFGEKRLVLNPNIQISEEEGEEIIRTKNWIWAKKISGEISVGPNNRNLVERQRVLVMPLEIPPDLQSYQESSIMREQ